MLKVSYSTTEIKSEASKLFLRRLIAVRSPRRSPKTLPKTGIGPQILSPESRTLTRKLASLMHQETSRQSYKTVTTREVENFREL